MEDYTAVAKVMDDEGDEESRLLEDNEDDMKTPKGVMKQMKFIGEKITEVSQHSKFRKKAQTKRQCPFWSIYLEINLINFSFYRVLTLSWDKNTFTLVSSPLFSPSSSDLQSIGKR